PGMLPPFEHFATDAIHYGQEPEQWNSWAVVPPITLSTAFKQEEPGKDRPYFYTRYGNPSRDVLEKVMSTLHGAKHQEHCVGWTSLSGFDGAKYQEQCM
ncbi:CGL lyase, partial [Picathartes gymnocephalus]|nr:CGL lyase [Picathartes gymnocephalus]